MFKWLHIGLLLLLWIPVSSWAADDLLPGIISTLEIPFKAQSPENLRIRDFQAEFFQESHIAAIDRTQHGKGHVSFKFLTDPEEDSSTASFRWEYREPAVQEIISDGQTLWVYLPENRQVIESDLRQVNARQGENPITFLSGLGDLSRDFVIALDSAGTDEDGNYLLLLEPRKESQLIRRMTVVVSRKAVDDWLARRQTGKVFPILSTRVTDALGNQTWIAFQNLEVNKGFADNEFSFTKPEGVEVVRPEEQLNF